MLTQTLRQLEEDALVKRQVFNVVPPHVVYQLSDQGQAVTGMIDQLDAWVRASSSSPPMPERSATK